MLDDEQDSAVQTSPKSSLATNRNVLAMVILAAVLTIHWRSSWLVNDPLWLDELHSVWVIDQGFGDVFLRAAAGNQSPLYFLLAWVVKKFTFYPELAVRGISAIAGAALLVLVGMMIWRWTRSGSAVLATVFVMAVSGSQLFYATEGRPYELLCLVGCVHVLLFLRWIGNWTEGATCKTPTNRWIRSGWLALFGVIAVLIHPLAILLVLAELAVVATWWSAYRSAKLVTVVKFAAVAFVPAIVTFPAVLSGINHAVVNRELWASVVNIDLTMTDMARGLVIPAVVLIVGLVVDRSAINRTDRGANSDHGTFALLVALFVVVALGVCGATWLGIAPLALPRYCMVVAAVPFLLTGLAVGSIRTPLARWFVAVAIAASMFLLPLPTNLTGNRDLATLSGFGWNGKTVSFVGSPLRNEPWREAWERVDLFPKVYLLANILEDHLLEPGNSTRYTELTNGITVEDYLKFPFAGCDPKKAQIWTNVTVIPVKTLNRPRFSKLSSKEFRWWLIIRGNSNTVDDAMAEFMIRVDERCADNQSSYPRTNSEGHYTNDAIKRYSMGDLTLVEIRLIWKPIRKPNP